MARPPTDRDFQKLAAQVNAALINNESRLEDQERQVQNVYKLEQKFMNHVCKYAQIYKIYEKFVFHITKEKGNVLSAKPYFREKSDIFSSKISKAIKDNNVQELVKYDVNFQLINFIIKNWSGNIPVRVQKSYDKFIDARRILIENNLPLAINRAKLFYRKTPKSHLTLLDFIDICTYGLISGIDKYVGEYSKVWRSVCIGRMVGYMIEEYSKTFLRMYPNDKKILYRANALKYRLKIEDVSELTDAVNESFRRDREEGKKIPKLPIHEIHIRTLLNGSSYISADSKAGSEDEEGVNIYDYTPDNSDESVDDRFIKKDLLLKILSAAKDLTIIERKIIKLKGVSL